MAPVIFRSTDASAPALNGNAGSLVNVLNWCLLSGGSGSNLGWGSPFTATNKAVYRAPAGVRHYLDVDDSGPNATALGRNAVWRGYETMSAVATGTGAFPTTTQAPNPVAIVKSTATGTTARPWLLIGDDRTFYFFCEPAGTDPPNLATHTWTGCTYFGEILSVLTGDLYRTYIGWQTNTATDVTASLTAMSWLASLTNTGAATQAMPRSYTGTGAAIWTGSQISSGLNSASPQPVGLFTVFPNPCDGGLYMNAIDVVERGTGAAPASAATSGSGFGGFRGRVRGLYQTPYGATGYNDQDTFTGSGDFAGKSFIILKTTAAMIVFDTGAWTASS